jgi:large subunit ribosomal protein L9
MKVILLQDVAKIGRKFEVVTVPDGYALNLLIPKKMAKAATPFNVKNLTAMKDHAEKARGLSKAEFLAAKEILEDKTVDVIASQNEQGHLFAALKTEVILAALRDRGANLEAPMMKLDKPIKTSGPHQISLICGEDKFEVTINVIGQ